MGSKTTRVPSFCAQCRSRCGCMAVVEDGKLTGIEPLAGHPSGEKLCPKGKASSELVYHQDRLTRPLRRTSPKDGTKPSWESISWDEALDDIAHRMAEIRDVHGAEQIAFSVTTPSGTHISDSISWIERFIRAFGSPNMIYGTEICNWHKDIVARFTYGTDIGTPDFAHTACVLLWGNNPANTWLARSVEIQKARARGARMIVVDPRPTVFARRADCWLRVKPGTDQALALGIARVLIEDAGYNHPFVAEWTNGPFLIRTDTGLFLRQSDITQGGAPTIYLASRKDGQGFLHYDSANGQWLDAPADADLHATCSVETTDGSILCKSAFSLYAEAASEHSLDWVERVTGVAEADIRHAAGILVSAGTTAYYAWNGVNQSATATQTERAISLLYGLTGCYGDKGGNMPGGATQFGDISGQELLSDTQRAKALGSAERPIGPARSGWVTARDVYRAALDQTPYPVRMLFSFGGNLLASQPDTALAIAAFRKLDFHVHTDFFLNATAEYADIVLPVATSWEREGLRTGFDASVEGMRCVQLRAPVIAPLGEARSDTDIVLALAERLGMADQFFGGDRDRGHDHILAPAGLSVARLRAHPEGFTLATTVPNRSYAERLADGGTKGFPTPTRRLEIYSETLLASGYDPVPVLRPLPARMDVAQFPLQLSGAKPIAYCHSQHRNIASLRRLLPDPLLEMSADAAEARNIEDGAWVEVRTATGTFVARAKVVRDIEPGSVFAQHGWWVRGNEDSPYGPDKPLAANMNGAISTALTDPVSGSIPMRSSFCDVAKI